MEQVKKLEQNDFIGRGLFVNNIVELLESADSEKSWTFAIDGGWGTGKSFVLKMIEERLDLDKYAVVKYDAWKNDFYQDPLIAILYQILDAIEKMNDMNDVLKGIKNGISVFCEILKLNSIVEKLEKTGKNITKKLTNTNANVKSVDISGYLSYIEGLEALKQQIEKITKDKKLVVLVDELDRCDPEYSLTVLNRLHNLLDVKNVIVIVAVNKNQLNTVIHNKYGNENGKYLEKFFDLTFALPVSGDIDIRIKYASDFCLTLFKEEHFEKLTLFMEIIKSNLNKDARSVVKFFERLRFIVKKFEEDQMTYDMVCFATYLLSINADVLDGIFTDELFGVRNIIYVGEGNSLDSFFKKELKDYIISSKRTPVFGNYFHVEFHDFEINRLFAMINIVRFINDDNVLNSVNNFFRITLSQKYLEEIKRVVNLINILNG